MVQIEGAASSINYAIYGEQSQSEFPSTIIDMDLTIGMLHIYVFIYSWIVLTNMFRCLDVCGEHNPFG